MKLEIWQQIDPRVKKLIESAFAMASIDFFRDYVEKDRNNNSKDFLSTLDEWWDLKQAGKFAHVSSYTIKRWVKKYGLKSRKLNAAKCGRVLIHAESLRRFVEGQESA